MEYFDLRSLLSGAIAAVIFGAVFVLISIVSGAISYFLFNAFRSVYVLVFQIRPGSLRSAILKDISLYVRRAERSHIGDFLFITTYGICYSVLSYAVHDGGVRLYMLALTVGSSYAFSKLFKVTVSRFVFFVTDQFLLIIYNLFSVLYVCITAPMLAINKINLKKLKK